MLGRVFILTIVCFLFMAILLNCCVGRADDVFFLSAQMLLVSLFCLLVILSRVAILKVLANSHLFRGAIITVQLPIVSAFVNFYPEVHVPPPNR